ncbi:MAG: ABC transporter substrate-binding protein [Candidatus Methanoperedens sp.]|nr:ABC transporter substrate-binding protein [Candidatus Methanoperedens sp.]MCZ7358442.1 ABC transporter substrate-binding protein [Candidatus Methanoperedens sp.]HLB70776.1 ABC transporter substrate-binding protein [Candidatus Methanoperedens sp.]
MKKYIYISIILSIGLLIILFAGMTLFEKDGAQKRIYVVSLTPDEMLSGLKNRTIAGFISWEPYPAEAVAEGYGRYLVNSTDIWENHPECVLAVSGNLRDEKMVRALVWAQIKSTRFINDPANREAVLQYSSELTGMDKMTSAAAINNTIFIEFPYMSEMKKGFEILNNAGGFKKDPASLGYKDADDFLSKIISDRYYNEIRRNLDSDPDWTPPAVNGSLRVGIIEKDIHNLGMYVAQKEGYFERIGLIQDRNLYFLKFRNGRAITTAFSHRDVDAAVFGATQVLRYAIDDNGKIYIVSGANTGGTALVVRKDSDISSIDDLDGKTIATPGFGSIQDVIMRKMFESFEIRTV